MTAPTRSAREYRRLRDLLKLDLQAKRIGAPDDDYLNGEPIMPLPAGALNRFTPLGNYTSAPSPGFVLILDSPADDAAAASTLPHAGSPPDKPTRRAVWWWIDGPQRRRPHRRTDAPVDRPACDDSALVKAVHELVRRGMKRKHAEQAVAKSLQKAAGLQPVPARRRLTKALR